jgi:tRNA nucleotidyltransferase (CCA-adding enzyme)
MKINNELKNIAAAIRDNKGELLVVGGYVRDYFLNLPSKDLDLEVYGLNFDQLREILSPFGKIDIVGEHYSVLKLTTTTEDYDFALPRTETKIGEGYKGFKVTPNSYLDYKSAFARRDFTTSQQIVL